MMWLHRSISLAAKCQLFSRVYPNSMRKRSIHNQPFTDLLHSAHKAARIGKFDEFREIYSLVCSLSNELTKEQWEEIGDIDMQDMLDQLNAIEVVLKQCDDDTVPITSSHIFSNLGYSIRSTRFQLLQVDSDDVQERDKYIAEFLEKMPSEMKDPFENAIETGAGEKMFEKMGCVYSICCPLKNVWGDDIIKMTGILKRNIGAFGGNMEFIECNSTKRYQIDNALWWQSVSCILSKDESDSALLRGMLDDRRMVSDFDGANPKEIVKALYQWTLKGEPIID